MPGRQHIWSGLIKRLCGALVLVLALHGQAGANVPPRAVVEKLNAALLESMRGAAQLGYDGRYHLLEPVLRQSFDFPFMTRIAVGRAWSDLSAADQERVTSLFAQMSIANFAARFDGYTGERFEILAEGPGPRDAVVVESRIVRPHRAAGRAQLCAQGVPGRLADHRRAARCQVQRARQAARRIRRAAEGRRRAPADRKPRAQDQAAVRPDLSRPAAGFARPARTRPRTKPLRDRDRPI